MPGLTTAAEVVRAIFDGRTCPCCGAPEFLRHFDTCPRHPDTVEKMAE